MDKVKKLSRASVVRMELYLEVLEQFQKDGKQNITSTDFGHALGIPSVNVRQDLFGWGSVGRPKVGYDVAHLIKLIRGLFDLDREKAACIVGFGNLGRALAGSNIWSNAGYRLAAVFDSDPEVIGTKFGDLRVRSIAEVFGFVKSEGVEMAVVAVPASAAQQTAEMMASAGVKALWNFAPAKIQLTDDVVVENQSLAWGLITLSHRSKSVIAKS